MGATQRTTLLLEKVNVGRCVQYLSNRRHAFLGGAKRKMRYALSNMILYLVFAFFRLVLVLSSLFSKKFCLFAKIFFGEV